MRTWAHCVSNLPDSMELVRNLDGSDVRHESEKVDRVVIIQGIVHHAKDELYLLSAGELDGISSNEML